MTIKDLIAEVRQLDASATPEPWFFHGDANHLRAASEDRPADCAPEHEALFSEPVLTASTYPGEEGRIFVSAENKRLIERYRTAAPPLADEVERLTTALDDALDEAKAADLHRNLNRRVAGALGLLDERVDAETGEAYLPSWHDMPEQVTVLRAEVERLTTERDAYRRTLDKEGAENAFAQDSLRDEIDMLRRERHAERLLVQDRTAEIVELRLTLAAEQGRAEGAPSPHWTYSGGTWSRVRFRVERDGDGFWSLLGLFGDAYCTLNHGIPARIAMQFGDRIDQIARLSHTGTEPDPDKTP